MIQNRYDLILVGGGMVGLAMAAALAPSGLSMLVVEKQPLDQQLPASLLQTDIIKPQDFALRVSAISPANRLFLQNLGAWQHLAPNRMASYQQMRVWDGDGQGSIHFSAAELAQADLGVIIENHLLQAALLKQINSFGNVTFCFSHSVESLDQQTDAVSLDLTDTDGNSQSISAQLLIAADGAHSKIRQLLGISHSEMDYQQTAFVANVNTQLPHQDTAWQRFTAFGPVAFLPLPQANLCSVVWSLDSDKAEQVTVLKPIDFAQQLQAAFESRLGDVELVSDFAGFALVKRHAKDYLSHRVALVGDAAHTIHPLAGQGVNIGFQDVQQLSQLILQLQYEKRDWGLQANLRPFERARKTENLIMQNAMSGFKNLFASDNMLLTMARNLGMNLLDNNQFIKNEVIKKAIGL
ncbi:MAG: UbiH/UbiF/VisC/COQ6 family ubiquinone biosynthesis hydroxylase [Enterobacterales bacterium]|nr:UbiH/UbiF/VisC/COQ6 family ubiquinone biosynthesis hydroxylase [Enterobacterales bacterium]